MKKAEAIFNKQKFLKIDSRTIRDLKKRAAVSPRGRFRLCFHGSNADVLQEMVIALRKGSYIHPHRHPAKKSESYHVIAGELMVVYFDAAGRVVRKLQMGPAGGRKPFIQRLAGGLWHMPVALSPVVIYHETYPGPFTKGHDVEYAPWAPSETEEARVKKFLAKVLSP